MNVKHQEQELIIKEEYISDPDPGSTSAMPTEEFEDCSNQSETTPTLINKKHKECNWYDFISSLKCKIKCQQRYFCGHCDYKTSQENYLKQHILTHGDKKLHHCGQCDFITSRKGSLTRHMSTHSGEKYHCEQCDFKTSHKVYLEQHILTHSGVKPHDCKLCDFKTYVKGSLKRHLLTHTGESSYDCEQYDLKTTLKRNLKHLLTHSGENSNHSAQLNTDSFNEDTKDSKKLISDHGIVPEECVVFNSIDFLIKEEPNDSNL